MTDKTKIPLLQQLPNPCWEYFEKCDQADLPMECATILLDPGSMTERLRKLNPSFGLKVLQEGFATPTPSEQELLGMKEEVALIRESELFCDNEIWMYGRSIFPVATLSGDEQVYAELGNRPLGDILFTDPRVKRSAFEFAKLSYQQCTYWIRRSLFLIEDKKILLTEFFMPALIGISFAPCRQKA